MKLFFASTSKELRMGFLRLVSPSGHFLSHSDACRATSCHAMLNITLRPSQFDRIILAPTPPVLLSWSTIHCNFMKGPILTFTFHCEPGWGGSPNLINYRLWSSFKLPEKKSCSPTRHSFAFRVSTSSVWQPPLEIPSLATLISWVNIPPPPPPPPTTTTTTIIIMIIIIEVVATQIFFCHFHPYFGKIPILTNMFQMGWTTN